MMVGVVRTVGGAWHSESTCQENTGTFEIPLIDISISNASSSLPTTKSLQGAYRDWPDNRGIFFSKDKKLMVWVNEEEHLNIFSLEDGSDLGSTYKRLVQALISLSKNLVFERQDGLGYVSTCPTSLGTGLHASVHIRIPRLSQQPDFQDILAQYSLEARALEEEDTQSVGGVYDVLYKRCLGVTEIDAMVHMATGIKSIVYLENMLKG